MKKAVLYTYNMVLLLVLLSLSGCTAEPKPVPYGEVNCAHCHMTVSDNRYGAELVNDKSKAFFFDSVECLAAYVNEKPEAGEQAAYLLVTDYTNPDNLIEAAKAHYLQSQALPSPMGMNLTAVADETTVLRMQQQLGGRLLTWEQVKLAVKNNDKF